jgi:hypothetical protein
LFIIGEVLTVNIAMLLATVPLLLLIKTANSAPLSDGVVAGVL